MGEAWGSFRRDERPAVAGRSEGGRRSGRTGEPGGVRPGVCSEVQGRGVPLAAGSAGLGVARPLAWRLLVLPEAVRGCEAVKVFGGRGTGVAWLPYMQGLAAAGACSSFRAFLGFSSARLRPGLGVAAVDLWKASEGLTAGGAWRSRFLGRAGGSWEGDEGREGTAYKAVMRL